MQRPARIEDIAALQKKVDSLSRKVDKLAKALAVQGLSDKPPARGATAARKAVKAKSAAKTPRKKAVTGRRKNS